MAVKYPKEFISETLVGEIKDIADHHTYLAFVLIADGIEFLGRCLDEDHGWEHWYRQAPYPFDNAVKELFPKKYHKPFEQFKVRDKLRNGMLHSCAPKKGLLLTEIRDPERISQAQHPKVAGDTLTLVVEYLYADLVIACKKVCAKKFKKDSKMNQPFLNV